MAAAKRKPRTSAADTATQRLRARILSGELPGGAALPGERELSETLGVSRLTLRTALTRLEAEGLVRSSHGAATRVQDFRATGGLPLLAHLAQLKLEGGQMPLALLRDVLELRRMVAVEEPRSRRAGGLMAKFNHQHDLRAAPDAILSACGAAVLLHTNAYKLVY